MKFSIVVCSPVQQHCAKGGSSLVSDCSERGDVCFSYFQTVNNNLTRLATPTSADAFQRCSYPFLLLRRRVNCCQPPLVASGPPSSLMLRITAAVITFPQYH